MGSDNKCSGEPLNPKEVAASGVSVLAATGFNIWDIGALKNNPSVWSAPDGWDSRLHMGCKILWVSLLLSFVMMIF